MARYKARTRPFRVPVTREETKHEREDSGVHLDEPSSPVSKNADDTNDNLDKQTSHPRHGITITKISKTPPAKSPIRHRWQADDISKGRRSRHIQDKVDIVTNQTDRLTLHDEGHGILKTGDDLRSSRSIEGQGQKHFPQDIKVSVTLSLEEDEGLDITDINPVLIKGDNSLDRLRLDSEPMTSSDNSEEGDSEHVQFYLDRNQTGNVNNDEIYERGKDVKKKRFRKLIRRPALKRSQSVGCEQDLAPEHALFLQFNPEDTHTEKKCSEKTENDNFRRMIHKTCSADAAMMANEILPLDPQELVKNKQKTSIARNMRKQLQKLRRRNTDSLLGVLSVIGGSKITPAEAKEWSNSFDTLLSDKNGLELFKSFLKSEFSEENIEFWIACEDFKTTRTNKLVARSQKIYNTFIAVKAPKQVNLDSKTRSETVTHLENPTRDIFLQAQKRIQFLMENDSYKRFLESETYKNLLTQNSSSGHR